MVKNSSKKNKEVHSEELKKQRSIEARIKEEANVLRNEYTKRTLSLITSGFGLIAALAWNEVIKQAIDIYIKPFFGEGTGLMSLFIYAVIVTLLVVTVSFQLSKLEPAEKK